MENDNRILDNEITNEANIINTDNDNIANYVETRNKKYYQILFKNLLEYIIVFSLIFNVSIVNSKGKSTLTKGSCCDNKITENSINGPFKKCYNSFSIAKDGKGNRFSISEEIEEYSEDILEDTLIIDLYCKKLYNFLVKEKITLEQFFDIISIMTSDDFSLGFDYETELDAFLDICFRDERSYPEKMIITMIRDGLSYDELDTVCAGCVRESKEDGTCYDECYAIASTLINRSHMKWCVDNFGTSVYALFTAPSQYSVWPSKDYLDYIGCIDLLGYQAAVDAFYTKEASHEYLQFRANSYEVNSKYEIFTKDGNKFFDKIKDEEYVPYEEFLLADESSMRLMLETTIKNLTSPEESSKSLILENKLKNLFKPNK